MEVARPCQGQATSQLAFQTTVDNLMAELCRINTTSSLRALLLDLASLTTEEGEKASG
jgi:hypothetical protein